MKREKILRIVGIIALLTGAAILLYPKVSNWLYQREVQAMKESFAGTIEEQKAQETGDTLSSVPYQDLLQACIDYNTQLAQEGQESLGTEFEEAVIDLAAYGIEDGIIGYIEIPAMDVILPIYLGASTTNMAQGAVQCGGTSLPIGSFGGVSANCVIAAHRGYRGAAMFREIQKLQVGDELIITNLWETLIYQVVETKIIAPTQVEEVALQEGRDMVTLSTCHPYRYNYQRYLVYAERVPDDDALCLAG